MSGLLDSLRQEFEDEEYRNAYVEDHLNTFLAAQIRVLRQQRGWSQQQLAEKLNTQQSGVSRIENVDYGSWKIETLKKLARAYGLRLSVSFEEFGTFLNELPEFGRENLSRRSYEEDPLVRVPVPSDTDKVPMVPAR